MFPCIVKMLFFYLHVFVKRDHIRTSVLFGSTKQLAEILLHSCVQFNDIADILQKEIIYSIIGQYVLIELSDYLCKVLMATNFLEKCRHFFAINKLLNIQRN